MNNVKKPIVFLFVVGSHTTSIKILVGSSRAYQPETRGEAVCLHCKLVIHRHSTKELSST